MNKRGQVFLIAAIILAIAVYSVGITYNKITVSPPLTEYRKLSDNYFTEYPKVANFARYNNLNEGDIVNSFNNAFLKFAKQKEPNFGVFYTYKDSSGNVHIVNTLNKKVLLITVERNAADQIKFELLPNGIDSTNNVCIEGVGCVNANVATNNFGGRYSNKRDLTGLNPNDKIKISTVTTNADGRTSTGSSMTIDLKDFTSTAITNSRADTNGEIGAVQEVRVISYA